MSCAGAQVPDGLRADPVDGARGRGRGRAAGHPCGAAQAGFAAASECAASVPAGPARPHACAPTLPPPPLTHPPMTSGDHCVVELRWMLRSYLSSKGKHAPARLYILPSLF